MNMVVTCLPQSGYVIGLMSGTSGDGIDAALVWIEEQAGGRPSLKLKQSYYRPYTAQEREAVFALFDADVRARFVAEMHVRMGQWFGDAARSLMEQAGIGYEQVVVIGSHGQSVCHYPNEGFTLQIGDPTHIALATGCPVVSDFRRQDVTMGGQGAPLVPFFDHAIYQSPKQNRVVLNIGGIANLTLIPPNASTAQLTAFDTGPGNMVLDELVKRISQGLSSYDADGALAASGCPNQETVARWIASDSYVERDPPKSTGREQYGRDWVDARLMDMRGWTPADQMATMTYFVAKTIALGIGKVCPDEFELIVGGGGRHNRTLIRWIIELCQPSAVLSTEEFGVPSDMKEAMAFALFAWEFVQGRSVSLPSVTGASRAVVLGQWTPSILA